MPVRDPTNAEDATVPRKDARQRVERGLYREGRVFWACATPIGSRQVVWRKLGEIGLMEARRRRDEFAVRTRNEPSPLRLTRTTIDAVASQWIADQEQRVAIGDLRTATLDIYKLGLRRHVLPELGRRTVQSITPDDLVAWHRQRQTEGFAADSIHAWWTPLRLVLAHAVRRGLIPANPADKLLSHERPKAGPSRQRFLTRSEMRHLLLAASPHYELALATGLFTGLRVSELLGLTWNDVDLEEKVVRVRFQMDRTGERSLLKTEAGRRDVILIDHLRDEFQRRRRASNFAQGTDLVFATSTGRTIGHRNLTRRGLENACARAGLSDVTFHVLRHTFASVLIGQGHDPVFVSSQLGHANPAITLRVYSHLFDARRHADRARAQLQGEFRSLLD
jgi:integrase